MRPKVIALICCLSSSPGLVVIEQCFLAELGLYRKAAVSAAPLRELGCLLCYTRRSALTRCTPGYWLTPALRVQVSLCAAELISPTREAVARSAEAPGEIISTAQRQMIYHRYSTATTLSRLRCSQLRRGRLSSVPGPLTLILKIPRVWCFSSRFARLLRPHRPPLRGAYWSSSEWVKCL